MAFSLLIAKIAFSHGNGAPVFFALFLKWRGCAQRRIQCEITPFCFFCGKSRIASFVGTAVGFAPAAGALAGKAVARITGQANDLINLIACYKLFFGCVRPFILLR